VIEVAEVFRRFAADYLSAHGASMLPSHRRAIDDILDCRTAALGGQVWRCEACNAEIFSYHSCVMGKFGNGESVGRFAGLGAVFQRSRSPLP
jgi:Transposase zinc-binding domain